MMARVRWYLCAVLCPFAAAETLTFTDVTDEAGVSYVQHYPNGLDICFLENWPGAPRFCEPERMTGGAAVGDYNGDGWDDLYVTRLTAPDILFQNNGDGTFTDVTDTAGLGQSTGAVSPFWRTNAALWADVDNDRDLDLLLSTVGGLRLYLWINDGQGHFTEQARQRGVAQHDDVPHIVFGLAVGDYDADGYLDLITTEWFGRVADRDQHHTKLFRNLGAAGPGRFVDVSEDVGFVLETYPPVNPVYGFAPAFVDLNDDGHLDIPIASDFITSKILWNNGDDTFTDGTVAAGVGTDENGMGSTFGDYDGDGDLDWFVTSIFDPGATCESHTCTWGNTGNRLYANNGDGTFSDATDAAGVRDGYWGWGAAFLDYDNDGDLDLTMTNGADFPFSIDGDVDLLDRFRNDPMRFWENDGAGGMTEVSTNLGVTDNRSGKGLLTFDYDRDGDLDLFVVNNSSTPVLYRNNGGNMRDWLRINFAVDGKPFEALNAVVQVQAKELGPVQLRHVGVGSHFLGQSERTLHFGLGDLNTDVVHQVTVSWPRTGALQTFADVAPNQVFTISPPTAEIPPWAPAPYHASDYAPEDWTIQLNELLRAIQLFNAGAYSASPGSEDGFAPGPGALDRHHSGDFREQNGRIDLFELLRIVQLYNGGAYLPADDTEDGFAPDVLTNF